MNIAKLLTGVVQSSTKSLLSSGLKHSVKSLIKKGMEKSPADIEKEIVNNLGYLTSHYKLDKQQNIVYRPSAVFFHEWLNNSPSMKGKVLRDEENGNIYYNGQPLTNQDKVKIIHTFIKDTNTQSPSLAYHFDAAMKLFDVSDITSVQFKEHFSGWKSDNTSVIDNFLEKCFGTALSSDPVYARMLFRRWMIGTVKRITTPGSTLDGALVFRGKTGVGKTAFFRHLLPAPFDRRTGEIYCDIKNPQRFVENLIGKSVASFDELSILEHEKSLETFKQLLTSQWIDVRMAWARSPRRFNIRTGLAGTSNKEKFITDPSLSRRLWVIEFNDSQRLDFDYYNANKKAIWQEALFLVERGETCILTPSEQQQVEEHNAKFIVQ